jgi:hypothetical protein
VGVKEDGSTLLLMGITTDLESGQINSILNQNGLFLDLIFSNASTDITVEICESPLLGLDRHHRAYELWGMCDSVYLRQLLWMSDGSDSGLLTVRR